VGFIFFLGARGLNFEAPLSPLKPPLPARPKHQTFLTLEPSEIPAQNLGHFELVSFRFQAKSLIFEDGLRLKIYFNDPKLR